MLPIRESMTYSASPHEVAALYSDPAYGRSRGKSFGVSEADVTVTGDADAGFTVVTEWEAPVHELDPKYRKFIGSAPRVTETQVWNPDPKGGYTGTISMDVHGVPVALTGTFAVTGTDSTASMSIEGSVKVSIPLVGSSLEKAAEPYVEKVFAHEQAHANGALRAHD